MESHDENQTASLPKQKRNNAGHYAIPEDVKSIGPDVLRHRIILTYEAEAQAVTTDAIIKKVFNAVPVP